MSRRSRAAARRPVPDLTFSEGYGGQYMFVIPALEFVVAFTGHNYENVDGIRNLHTMMRSHIPAAID
jgi:hypothetical protein